MNPVARLAGSQFNVARQGPRRKSRIALIVGGGIGGLAAAIALRQAGWEPRILERAQSPQELGFDLMLASNAQAALRELGIAAAVAAASVTIESVRVTIGRGGRPRRFDVSAVPAAARPWIASRQGLHGVLLDAIGPGAITFDAEAVAFSVHSDTVRVEVRDGRVFTGDILVGADGIRSAIRKQLHPTAVPRPHRLTGLRGVAYGVQHLLEADLAMALVPGGDSGIIRGAGDAVYWFFSSREQPVGDLRTAEPYVRGFGEPLATIVRATRPEDMRVEYLVDGDPLAWWGAGRVTLLGDAAHPMFPHAGQGAAQALEDAVALGLALHAEDSPDAALRRYEGVRRRRTSGIVLHSRRLSRLRTTRSRVLLACVGAAIHTVPSGLVSLTRLIVPRDPHKALRSESHA